MFCSLSHFLTVVEVQFSIRVKFIQKGGGYLHAMETRRKCGIVQVYFSLNYNLHVVLILVISKMWHIIQANANNTFFNGIFQEEVFIQQSSKFKSFDTHLMC